MTWLYSGSYFLYCYGYTQDLHVRTLSFPTRRSSDLTRADLETVVRAKAAIQLGEDVGDAAQIKVAQHIARQRFDIAAGQQSRDRSEEHTSELQSLMRISYAVFCLQTKKLYAQGSTIPHRSPARYSRHHRLHSS